jgi:MtfA peptidase
MRAWPRQIIFVHAALGVVLALFVALSLAVVGPTWLVLLGPVVGGTYYRLATRRYRRRRRLERTPFPDEWREILARRVPYYGRLPHEGQRRFENDVRIFVAEQRIFAEKGATIDTETLVLIAAGAAMLGYSLRDWEWDSVRDIVVYPRAFDEEYRADRDRVYSGMVHRQGPIVLSQPQIHEDFASSSGQNVVLHEFAHVMDFADGHADGAPPDVDSVSPLPWFDIIANRLERARKNRGALRAYAGTNEAELFAVAVETFFEQPEHLKRRDPTLYRMLSTWFDQDPAGSEPGAFPGRSRRARERSMEQEPWGPSFAYSDVSTDPRAIERVRAVGGTEREIRALGFEPLGIARAVSTTDPTVQLFSRVLRSADGAVLCSITPTPRGPRLELATLFEDGSVTKTAPPFGFWEGLRISATLPHHPDDGYELRTAAGTTEQLLYRHRERIRELESVRHLPVVGAESMTTHFALRLRGSELRDARRPAETRIARRAAVLAAVLLGAAIWAPFLARLPRAPPHHQHEGPEPTTSIQPDHGVSLNRAMRLAYFGMLLAVAVSGGAYGALRFVARILVARRLARLRPGPRKPSAKELLARAERIERCAEERG